MGFMDQAKDFADKHDEQVDQGRNPERFARLWIHTHPANCAEPSPVDEETFARVFGSCTWAVMAILAKGGQTYARLRFGVGPTAWTSDAKERTHIRRRFLLLGQTLDGMRVWDIRQAIRALGTEYDLGERQLTLRASGPMAVDTLLAALYEPSNISLELAALPATCSGVRAPSSRRVPSSRQWLVWTNGVSATDVTRIVPGMASMLAPVPSGPITM